MNEPEAAITQDQVRADLDQVGLDFDRLALLSGDGWDHNSHYCHSLLKYVPPDC